MNSFPLHTIETAPADAKELLTGITKRFGFLPNVCVLVGRNGTADDVARVVAFLLSPSSGFINSACIPIDGGMSISM